MVEREKARWGDGEWGREGAIERWRVVEREKARWGDGERGREGAIERGE